jgi:mRNA interferase RelE/StbE
LAYQVLIKPTAEKQIAKLPKKIQKQIIIKLRELRLNPRPHDCRKLTNEDLYKLRVGDYRIIYQIQDEILYVTIVRVGHRKEVYRCL